MPEILTESFCERCGTRYTFETNAPKPKRIGRFKVLSKGLRNFVMSDDTSFDEAFAAARNDQERETVAHQLDAFHKAFNFCMSCRQYTCSNCWNQVEARCLTCSPTGQDAFEGSFPQLDPRLALGFERGAAAPGEELAWPAADVRREAPAAPEAPAWPEADTKRKRSSRKESPARAAWPPAAVDAGGSTAPASELAGSDAWANAAVGWPADAGAAATWPGEDDAFAAPASQAPDAARSDAAWPLEDSAPAGTSRGRRADEASPRGDSEWPATDTAARQWPATDTAAARTAARSSEWPAEDGAAARTAEWPAENGGAARSSEWPAEDESPSPLSVPAETGEIEANGGARDDDLDPWRDERVHRGASTLPVQADADVSQEIDPTAAGDPWSVDRRAAAFGSNEDASGRDEGVDDATDDSIGEGIARLFAWADDDVPQLERPRSGDGSGGSKGRADTARARDDLQQGREVAELAEPPASGEDRDPWRDAQFVAEPDEWGDPELVPDDLAVRLAALGIGPDRREDDAPESAAQPAEQDERADDDFAADDLVSRLTALGIAPPADAPPSSGDRRTGGTLAARTGSRKPEPSTAETAPGDATARRASSPGPGKPERRGTMEERAAAAAAQTADLLARFRPGENIDEALAAYEAGVGQDEAPAERGARPEPARTADRDPARPVPPAVEPPAATPGPRDRAGADPRGARPPASWPEPVAPHAARDDRARAPRPAGRDDRVEMPPWGFPDEGRTAADAHPAPPAPRPASPPAPAQPSPLRPARTAASPQVNPSTDARAGGAGVWAASSGQVVSATGPDEAAVPAVQPCVSCGLSLSATARFCRRCGSPQG